MTYPNTICLLIQLFPWVLPSLESLDSFILLESVFFYSSMCSSSCCPGSSACLSDGISCTLHSSQTQLIFFWVLELTLGCSLWLEWPPPPGIASFLPIPLPLLKWCSLGVLPWWDWLPPVLCSHHQLFPFSGLTQIISRPACRLPENRALTILLPTDPGKGSTDAGEQMNWAHSLQTPPFPSSLQIF